MNFLTHFNKALEFEDYVKLLGENLSLHKLHHNNFDLQNVDAQKIKRFPPMNILAITEPWCGDSFALLPVVKKISEANSTWKLKILLRDKNLDLIDRFLTKGGRAIPIFLFLDNDYELLFKWGPRPMAAQNIFEQFRTQINNGEIEKSKVILKIRQFYSRNKGKESSQELFNLIYSSLKKN
jgi:hypothetical protein